MAATAKQRLLAFENRTHETTPPICEPWGLVMTTTRIAVMDFSLANPVYVGARVTFWTIDATLAPRPPRSRDALFRRDRATTVSNPQTLDGEGKLRRRSISRSR
jgi:hypothetical protein